MARHTSRQYSISRQVLASISLLNHSLVLAILSRNSLQCCTFLRWTYPLNTPRRRNPEEPIVENVGGGMEWPFVFLSYGQETHLTTWRRVLPPRQFLSLWDTCLNTSQVYKSVFFIRVYLIKLASKRGVRFQLCRPQKAAHFLPHAKHLSIWSKTGQHSAIQRAHAPRIWTWPSVKETGRVITLN
jgi:hypothetical protein